MNFRAEDIHHDNRSLPYRRQVLEILAAALNAAAPERAVREALTLEGDLLHCAGTTYPLDNYNRIIMLGAGKAGAPMARAVEELLGERLDDGLVVVREGYTAPTDRVELYEAAHPVPDARSEEGARRVLTLAESAGPNDLVLVLLSGGGSALLVAPAEGLSLTDVQHTTDALIESGAAITEINAVRKHCSAIKGGQLAQAIAPADMLTLVLSDVVGNPLDAIASGPTVADPTSYRDAWDVIEGHNLVDKVPDAVLEHLRRGCDGERAETPSPDDAALAHSQVTIVGDCTTAAEAAAEAAASAGFDARIMSTRLAGEAREVARVIAGIAREIRDRHRPFAPPACAVFAGETTVTVRGDGSGGRNQELALAAARAIAGQPGIIVAALATDGTDGPTDAAGAIIDADTLKRGRDAGLDATAHLDANNSSPYLDATGDLLRTGPTNTNVNDLVCVFVT